MLTDYGARIANGTAFALEDAGGVAAPSFFRVPMTGLCFRQGGHGPSGSKMRLWQKIAGFRRRRRAGPGLGRIILSTSEAVRENLAWCPKPGSAVTGHVAERGSTRISL